MPVPAFHVHVDVTRNRLDVTLAGFATMDDVVRFDRDLRQAFEQLSVHCRPHQLLYDVSAAKIQSQEVVHALRELAARAPRTSACALVNASALAGRQLQRIFVGAKPHVCKDRATAIAWLDAQAKS